MGTDTVGLRPGVHVESAQAFSKARGLASPTPFGALQTSE